MDGPTIDLTALLAGFASGVGLWVALFLPVFTSRLLRKIVDLSS